MIRSGSLVRHNRSGKASKGTITASPNSVTSLDIQTELSTGDAAVVEIAPKKTNFENPTLSQWSTQAEQQDKTSSSSSKSAGGGTMMQLANSLTGKANV
jgi:hypothetical protein